MTEVSFGKIRDIKLDILEKSGVYAVINPKEQIYVGSSNNVKRRLKRHASMYENNSVKLFNSLKKYGVDNHEFIVLEYCRIDILFERERYWGDYFNSLDRQAGLNLMLPGHGDVKTVMSDETKKKIGSRHKGKKLSEKHKEALTTYWLGKKQSQEHINKRKMLGKRNPAYGKAYFKGKKHTEKNKELFSKNASMNNKGRNNPNAKKVLDKQENVIYPCAKDASKQLGINYSTLKAWLQGRNRSDGRFEYIE